MKRLWRSLPALLAVTSLLVVILALAWAVRSFWVADGIAYGNGSLMASRGDLLISYTVHDGPPRSPGLHYVWIQSATGRPLSEKSKTLWGIWSTLAPIGFGYTMITDYKSFRHYRAMMPLWFVAMLASVMPLIWTYHRYVPHLRRKRRIKAGLCPTCAYDLRATPQRCPECGSTSDIDDDKTVGSEPVT